MNRTLLSVVLAILAIVLVVSAAQQLYTHPAAPTTPADVTAKSSTGASANLDQCRNGGVGATPVPCNPTTKSPLGWVNGNAQGQQAHWREGDSIAYRAVITGLTPGSAGNTLLFNWSTVHGSHHAIDYITSYDRTETTSPTPSLFYANNNNPCSDALPTADCNPAVPTSFFGIPDPIAAGVLTNCGGSAGTFAGTIPTGADMQIKAYGAAGTAITAVSYQSIQTPSGSGQCSTGFLVTFTAGSGGTVVLAWGGHIASQADWGFGNSASYISGSPYHMFLDSLNGASTGAQDRALATSAIFFTPTIATTIFNAATDTAVAGTPPTAPAGTSVYDTATLSSISPLAGGTVYYNFFTNGACTLPYATNQSVTVSGSVVPNSPTHGPLAAGSYSFNAYYTGDSNNNVFPAVSACEPLTIVSVTPTITTQVSPATLTLGTSPVTATDTATISGGVNPTGTVVFTVYYNDNTCSAGNLVFTSNAITVSGDGTYTSAPAFTPTKAGTYYWIASYSGDSNNDPVATQCGDSGETLTVSPATPDVTTAVSQADFTLGDATFTVADTATLSGGYSPTGSILFSVYNNGACTGTPLFTSTKTVSGNGDYTSDAFTIPGVGTYYWIAAYSGDSNNVPFATKCGEANEVVHVSPAVPTISTVATPSQFQLTTTSTPVTDIATLSGGFAPTGTITFTLYFNDATCSGTPVFTSNAITVSGNGAYTSAPSYTPTVAGTYYWIAAYSGDSNNDAYTTHCGESGEVLTVLPSTPGVTTAANPSAITLGNGVFTATDTAYLTGGYNPTGTITFTLYNSAGCTGSSIFTSIKTVSGNGAYTSAAYTVTAVGTYYWIASYSGDTNNAPFATKCGDSGEVLTVSPASPEVSTQVTPSTITLGNAPPYTAFDTATLSGGFAPTGTITFRVYFDDVSCTSVPVFSNTVPVSGNGAYASGALTVTAAGTYYWVAQYSGDTNNVGFTTACGDSSEILTVSPASPGLVTSPSPQTQTLTTSAQPVTDTATLSGGFNPTGTITFEVFAIVGGTCSGGALATSTATVIGNGDYTSAPFTPLSAGTYVFVVTYSGDNNNLAFGPTSCSDQTEQFTVSPAQPGLVTAPSPKTQTLTTTAVPVTDSATLSGGFNPTGTITFQVFLIAAGTCSGSALATSTATVSGNGVYQSAPFTPLAAGTYVFVVSYSGDTSNLPIGPTSCSDTSEQFTVNPAQPGIVTSPSPQTQQLTTSAQPVTDTATLSGGFQPTGTITFQVFAVVGGTCSGAALATSTATVNGNGDYTSAPFTPAAAGTYVFVVSYTGDANNNPFGPTSCADTTEQFVVSPAQPGLVTSPSPQTQELTTVAQPVTDTATLSGGFAPTGTITFQVFLVVGGTCSGSALATSTATVSGNGVYHSAPFTPGGTGTYVFVVSYTGDANNLPFGPTSCSDTSEQFSVTPATPGLVTSPSPQTQTLTTAALPVTDTATLSGGFQPTGTITFQVFAIVGGTCSGPALATSTATVSGNGDYTSAPFTPTAAGTYVFVVTYSGDGNNQPFGPTSCADITEQFIVNPALPGVVTSPSPKSQQLTTVAQPVTDTATLSGGFNPTGTITFQVFLVLGGTCSGTALATSTATVSGNGDYTSAPFTPAGTGTYVFVVSYSGDANNQPFGPTSCSDKTEQFTVSPAQPGIVTSPSPPLQQLTTAAEPVTDTATLSGGFDPTGTITFQVFLVVGGTCSGPALATSTATVSGNGQYFSAPFTPTAAGTYVFVVTYSGDSNNLPFGPTSCADTSEQFVVSPAQPGIVTSPSPQAQTLTTVAQPVTDTAILSGGFEPTGTITFQVFLVVGGTCSGSALATSTATVSGNGPYFSAPFTPAGTGLYVFVVSYSGDSNNLPFGPTSCADTTEQFVVNPAQPGIVTAPFPQTQVLTTTAQPVTDTATLSGGFQPTGTITFQVFAVVDGTCSGPALATSTATVSGNGDYTSAPFTPPSAGTYVFVVSYTGDANNDPFVPTSCADTTEQFVVNPALPGLVTSPSPQIQQLTTVAQPVTDTATLSDGFAPTGTITFQVFLVVGGTCSGSALATSTATVSGNGNYQSAPYTPTATGLYVFVVSYSGDSNNLPFGPTSCADQTEQFAVGPSAPGIVTSPSPQTQTLTTTATPVTDTATLSGGFNPTGTITFQVFLILGSTCYGSAMATSTATVSGNGDYTSAPFTPPFTGKFVFVVSYSGDSNNMPFGPTSCTDTSEQFLVFPAQPEIVTSPSPKAQTLTTTATPVTDTATLSGGFEPTGTITFQVFLVAAGTCSGSALATSTAAVSGNGDYTSAPFTPTGAGTYVFVVSYSGDPNNLPFGPTSCADATEQFTVQPASPSATTQVSVESFSLTTTSQAVTDTATFTGGFFVPPATVSGTLTFLVFYNDASCGGTPVFTSIPISISANGPYTSNPFVPDAVGVYTWMIVYTGDANNLPFSICGGDHETVTVGPASPSITTLLNTPLFQLTTVSQPVTDTATLSGGFFSPPASASGTITFTVYYDDPSCSAGSLVFTSTPVPVDANGAYVQTPAFTPFAAGPYYWVASYTGDLNNNPFTTACGASGEVLIVLPASPSGITALSPETVQLTTTTTGVYDAATFSGGFFSPPASPSGTLTFNVYLNDGTCTSEPVFSSGPFTVSHNGVYLSTVFGPLQVGVYTWQIVYTGDLNNVAFTNCGGDHEVLIVRPATPSGVTHLSSEGFALTTSSHPVTDTATISGGFFLQPSQVFGTLTFNVYLNDGTCTSEPVFSSGPFTVDHNGDYLSAAFTPTQVGVYTWQIVYTGDLNNVGFNNCGGAHEVLTVTQAGPNIVTSVSSALITLGDHSSTVFDTATLSGGFAPTGSITFTVYNTAGCTGGPVFTSTVPVNGNGAYPSAVFTIPGAGTYSWIASYSGDLNNAPATTHCGDAGEVVTVSPAPPAVVTQVSVAAITLSDATFQVTDTATLTGGFEPTGTMTFNVYDSAGCTGGSIFTSSVPVSGNGAYMSAAFTIPGAGTYYWIASYSGDANNNAFQTSCGDANEVVTVAPASPTATTAVSIETFALTTASTPVTDTATFTGGFFSPPASVLGTLTFTVYYNDPSCGAPNLVFTSSPLTVDHNGAYVSDAFTPAAVGTYTWQIAYSGDVNNNPFTICAGDHETVTVTPSSPSGVTALSTEGFALTTSSQPVTDTATISGGYFLQPSQVFGTLTFNVYLNDGTCTSEPVFSSGPFTVDHNGAYVSGAFTPLQVGVYTWQIVYTGDLNNVAFTNCGGAHEVLTVGPSSPSASTLVSQETFALTTGSTPVTDTASFIGGFFLQPSQVFGTLTFYVYYNDASCGAANLVFTSNALTVDHNGLYTSNAFTPLAVGTYTWQIVYTGDLNNNAFTNCGGAHETVTVTPSSPTGVTALSTESFALTTSSQPVTDTATISGGYFLQPSQVFGTLTFNVYLNSGSCVGTPVFSSGPFTVDHNGDYVSAAFTPTQVGIYTWQIVYTGDLDNVAFTNCGGAHEVLTVRPSSPSATTAVSIETFALTTASTPVTDTATFSDGFFSPPASPSGTLTFKVYYNDASCGAANLVFTSTPLSVDHNGAYVSDAFTPLAVGTYTWQVVYTGDLNNVAFTICGGDHETVDVTPATPSATTAVSIESFALSTGSQPVTDTATFSGGYFLQPSQVFGTLTFNVYLNSGSCVGTPVFSSGPFTVDHNGAYVSGAFTPLQVGIYTWQLVYTGDLNNVAFTNCGGAHETVTVTPSTPTGVTALSTEEFALTTSSQPVTDTATISDGYFLQPGQIFGTLTFNVYLDDGTCSGVPVFSSGPFTVDHNGDYLSAAFTPSQVGTYTWEIVYTGDLNNNAFTNCGGAHEVLTVLPATPTVTTVVSDESITLSDGTFQVADTATLSGAFQPTGSITFSVYDTAGCTGGSIFTSSVPVTANGDYTSAAFTIPGVGTYSWIASYSGDANNNAFQTGCGDAHEVVTVSPAEPNVVTQVSDASITLTSSPVTVSDTATLSGGYKPTGTMTFNVYDSAGCTGGSIFTSTVPVNGNGVYVSSDFTIPGAGTYYWIASYSGDANNNAFQTSCGDANEVVTVAPASPSVTTALSVESFDIPANSQAVTDTATLTGGFEPTGTITFTVFLNSASCSGTPVFTSDAIPVSGNGAYTSSPGFTPTLEGTYYWIAAYSGDSSNNAFTTGCGDAHEVLTVTSTPGTIIVNKVALGGDGLFGYTTTGGSNLPASFSIQTTSGTGTVTYTGIDVHNTYSIAETSMPAGWHAVSVSCSDGSNSVDPAGFNVPAGGTVTCTFTNTRSFGQITDTTFCPFDTDPNVPGAQFNVLFTKSGSGYKISSTNPGQFYYNVFFYGTPGSSVTITASLPWPFVTQGAQPVHVYSGYGVTSSGCLLQNNDVTRSFSISGTPVTLSSYAQQKNGQTATITLTGTVPSTGLAYVTIHIMWGLNKTAGWTPVGGCSGACIADAKNSNGMELPNNFAYAFAFTGTGMGSSLTTSAYNENRFQN